MLRSPDKARAKLNNLFANETMITFVEKMAEEIIVICYGQISVWKNRRKAIQFYLEAMQNSDGSERIRYSNIYCDLLDRKNICKDEDD